MEFAALGLAIIPPALAMLVERLNPISENLIETNAKRDLKDFETLAGYNVLIETVTKATTAAVEVAGLAPTLVASITSGFAVIHELPSPFWPTIVYVLILIPIVLYLLVMLGGHSFFEIDDASFDSKFCGATTRTKMVSRIIYFVNILLIVLSAGVFVVLNYVLSHFSGVKP
jgi:hypothetical protein